MNLHVVAPCASVAVRAIRRWLFAAAARSFRGRVRRTEGIDDPVTGPRNGCVLVVDLHDRPRQARPGERRPARVRRRALKSVRLPDDERTRRGRCDLRGRRGVVDLPDPGRHGGRRRALRVARAASRSTLPRKHRRGRRRRVGRAVAELPQVRERASRRGHSAAAVERRRRAEPRRSRRGTRSARRRRAVVRVRAGADLAAVRVMSYR